VAESDVKATKTTGHYHT